MPGCGKSGKPKAGFPLFPRAPWKSRQKAGEISTFPQLRRRRRMEKWKTKSRFSTFPPPRFLSRKNKKTARGRGFALARGSTTMPLQWSPFPPPHWFPVIPPLTHWRGRGKYSKKVSTFTLGDGNVSEYDSDSQRQIRVLLMWTERGRGADRLVALTDRG